MNSTLRFLALAALLASASSCAVGTTAGPPPASMPAARAGLQPEYRIFYDALKDYGDWVLIEPYGYLFRPRTVFNDWRPYESGFWAPTDAYGWVWISDEPYGWATYHYGRWLYDDFQGWVWKPGVEWAPAWVGWRSNDDYIGWAPLGPGGGIPKVPGGAFLFTRVDAMGSTDLATHVQTQAQLGAQVAGAQPITETLLLDGARVPSGPPVDRIEQLLGKKLPRARLEDVLTQRAAGDTRPGAGAGAPTLEDVQRAGEQASREAKAAREHGGPASGPLPLLRPPVRRGLAPRPSLRPPVARDTTRHSGG